MTVLFGPSGCIMLASVATSSLDPKNMISQFIKTRNKQNKYTKGPNYAVVVWAVVASKISKMARWQYLLVVYSCPVTVVWLKNCTVMMGNFSHTDMLVNVLHHVESILFVQSCGFRARLRLC